MLWKSILKSNFTKMDSLADFLELDEANRSKVLFKSDFILNLPLRLAKKIKKNSLDDPIFLQFVPLEKELKRNEGYSPNPLEEDAFKEGKLLSKYPSRSLIVTTSACAVHCRYCFRREYPYETERKDFLDELDVIRSAFDVEEIILSGGDPLSLSDNRLSELLGELNKIEHIKRIRFHTRFPIGIPERITQEFLNILSSVDKQIWFVLHINHASELDQEVIDSLKKISKLGVPLLNQSVLLKGVNDTEEAQADLLKVLSNAGIQPYYLHQLDQVQGAEHFFVEQAQGKSIIESLSNRFSGFMIPRYVKEIPHRSKKTPL